MAILKKRLYKYKAAWTPILGNPIHLGLLHIFDRHAKIRSWMPYRFCDVQRRKVQKTDENAKRRFLHRHGRLHRVQCLSNTSSRLRQKSAPTTLRSNAFKKTTYCEDERSSVQLVRKPFTYYWTHALKRQYCNVIPFHMWPEGQTICQQQQEVPACL